MLIDHGLFSPYWFSQDPAAHILVTLLIATILLLVAAGFIKVIVLFIGALLRGDFFDAAGWALLVGLPWLGFWLFNRTGR
jgi:hypothetical protein